MTMILGEVPPAPVVPVASRPLERLEAEIVELSSQLTAATSRLLGLVGEFDVVEGLRAWGMRSTAHWLSWQCGVGLTAGREQVRVARALRLLPLVAGDFAAGRLSYSKVRAVSRVATVETEATLVDWRCTRPRHSSTGSSPRNAESHGPLTCGPVTMPGVSRGGGMTTAA
jgi:hypothetical protein